MDGATLLLDLALIVGAYLCGSIPMGVLVARLTGGVGRVEKTLLGAFGKGPFPNAQSAESAIDT